MEEKLTSKSWRLNNLYYILTKDKRFQPMQLNAAQAHYIENKGQKNMVLKARQLGFSTLGLIDLLDDTIFNKNTNSAIIAHEKQKVIKLFEIIKRAYWNLPDDPRLKPRVSIENKNELYFPDINSKIYVTVDTRSETVHNLHVSELDFIPHAEERMAATLESVPEDVGQVTFETTANGMGNYGFKEWSDPNSDFKKHFYGWFWEPNYRIPTNQSMGELMEIYRPYAIEYGLIEDLPTRFDLDEEQMAFYLSKVKRHRKLVMQEYPSTDQEAFISSGRNVFSSSDVAKHIVMPPIARRWDDCLIWEEPQPNMTYSLGVDPSEGTGGDNAVIEILNSATGNQACEFATPYIPPDELGAYVIDLARYYNNAFVVPEMNSVGISLIDHIKHKYSRIYRREIYDKATKKTVKKLGFRTSSTTKTQLVTTLEEAIREEDIKLNSRAAIAELLTFVRLSDSSTHGFGAEGDNKDDRVMALALALQGFRQMAVTKVPLNEAQKRLKQYIDNVELVKMYGAGQAAEMVTQRTHRYKLRKG